jgi:hypothetical protein
MSYAIVTRYDCPGRNSPEIITGVAYPKRCKGISAHFEAALVDPMEKSPKDASAFLGDIGVDLCQSDRLLTLGRLIV